MKAIAQSISLGLNYYINITPDCNGKVVPKIICYELNEVPWRVVDYYLGQNPNSNLAKLLANSAQLTTHTVDSGELHPWSTWPSVHRGVSNDVHNIRFLNQDLTEADAHPPAWQLIADGGVSCGVFGSLQSYPPKQHHNINFHIPDTFAECPKTIPKSCEAFQTFNLSQTGNNKAVAGSLNISHVLMALGLLRSGIRPKTYLKIAKHLINEKLNPLYKTRRALLQPELAFDVFLSCFKKYQPNYVTFFSNHVAGIMHRYWKYTFPEDFGYDLDHSAKDQFYSQSILTAMDIFDSQLGELLKIANKLDYEIVVLSSMGQEAIERGDYIPEVRLADFQVLVEAMKIDYPVSQNLAMQPDVAFKFDSSQDLQHFQSTLSKLTDISGRPIFKLRLEPVGRTLNLSMRSSKELVADKHVYFEKAKYALADIGLQLITRDIGTGYHQPEGILIWQNLDTDLAARAIVDSRCFLPTLLKKYDLQPAEYMKSPITHRKNVAA